MLKTRIISILFVFTFCTFLITPGLVTIFEKNSDVSYFFSMAEEEEHSEIGKDKPVKDIFPLQLTNVSLTSDSESKSASYNLQTHKNSDHSDLIIPPPEYIS